MQFELDLKSLAEAVKSELARPQSVWDDIVPILETDHTITIYLTDQIGEPSDYNEMCHRLITSDKPVTLVLNTPGGISYTAFMIINAMRQCKHPIHGIITGSVASAGTVITMECDTIEVAPYAEFMIHNYSHGASGTGAQVKDYVDFTDREFSKAVTEIYNGFLTEAEMQKISRDDKEIWLNRDEVLERWARKQSI